MHPGAAAQASCRGCGSLLQPTRTAAAAAAADMALRALVCGVANAGSLPPVPGAVADAAAVADALRLMGGDVLFLENPSRGQLEGGIDALCSPGRRALSEARPPDC